MRDAVAWSYDLLDPQEQSLFRLLSAFDGGFSLLNARALVDVLATAGTYVFFPSSRHTDERAVELLDGIAGLASQSLIRRDDGPGDPEVEQPRFTMLETIRSFAWHQLVMAGEEAIVMHHHAALFRSLVARSAGELIGPRERETIDLLDGECQNLRAALVWLEEHEPSVGVEMAADLWLFWYRTGRVAEGEGWLRRGLVQCPDGPAAVRGKALFVWGALAAVRGEFALAEARLLDAVAVLNDGPDITSLALAETSLGVSALYSGKPDVALAALHRAERLYPLAQTMAARALGAFSQCQLVMARHLLRPAPDDADDLSQAVERVRESGSRLTLLPALSMKATVNWNLGDVAKAASIWREALTLAWAEGERWLAVDPLFGIAAAFAEQHEPRTALRLLGAVDACCVATGTVPLIAGAMTARIEQRAAAALDEAEISRLRDEGAIAPLSTIVGNLLPVPQAPGQLSRPLSPRERDVLRLMADGRSDPEIAATLVVSRRTVATHVASVFHKLGVHSRAAASARAVRLGII